METEVWIDRDATIYLIDFLGKNKVKIYHENMTYMRTVTDEYYEYMLTNLSYIGDL